MPIYEYRCSACSHELEALQKLSEAPLVTCPACGAATLVKKVSAAGFQLKGSGWYATDFRNAGKPAAKPDKPAAEAKGDAKTDGADANPADTKSDAKSDSKSESKSDAKPAAAPAPAATSSSTSTSGPKPE
jgi:putative FmdB family regulatory protein